MKTLAASTALAITTTSSAFVPMIPFGVSPSPPCIRSRTLCGATLEGWQIEGQMKPLNNFILVKTAGIQEETADGILLAGSAKVKKTEGTVISAGPGKVHQESGTTIEIPVASGDSVVYGKYDGTEVDFNGDVYSLIRDDDVLIKYSGDALTVDSVEVVYDAVLVLPRNDNEVTSGGLFLGKSKDDSETAAPSTGEVVKVGPGKMAADGSIMAMNVSAGDKVKFRSFAGNEVTIEGVEYTVVKMPDILAKF